MISVCFQGKSFSITVIQVYIPTNNAEELKLNSPTRPFRTNTKIDVLSIIRDWNVKVGSQEIPRVTGEIGLGIWQEEGQRLTGFQENTLVIANTFFQQHKRWLYTWLSPDGPYLYQIVWFWLYYLIIYLYNSGHSIMVELYSIHTHTHTHTLLFFLE